MQPLIDFLLSWLGVVTTMSSGGIVNTYQISNTSGFLIMLHVEVDDCKSQFIQIFDNQLQPQAGDVPIFSRRVTAKKNIYLQFGLVGFKFNNGCWISLSTGRNQYTPNGCKMFVTATKRDV